MSTLTMPDSHRDLVTSTTVALSTINDDGSIQTTAVWVLLDGDGVLRTSLAKNRKKYSNLVARPQATIFAIASDNPFHTLECVRTSRSKTTTRIGRSWRGSSERMDRRWSRWPIRPPKIELSSPSAPRGSACSRRALWSSKDLSFPADGWPESPENSEFWIGIREPSKSFWQSLVNPT